jgi:hypothetical protein
MVSMERKMMGAGAVDDRIKQNVGIETGKEKLQELLRKHMESVKSGKVAKESGKRKLARAIITLGLSAEAQLSGGEPSYEANLTIFGLPANKGKSPKELEDEAAGICMRNGLSAQDVSKGYLGIKPSIQPARELSVEGRNSVKLAEQTMAAEIAVIYRRSTGHAKRKKG